MKLKSIKKFLENKEPENISKYENIGNVSLTSKSLGIHLDKLICKWRIERIYGQHQDVAKTYIDAYQTLRISIFGELLSAKIDPVKHLNKLEKNEE